MTATMLQFGAKPSNSLPAVIASFAHPIHVDAALLETDLDAIFEDASECNEEVSMVAPAPILGTSSSERPVRDQASKLEPCV